MKTIDKPWGQEIIIANHYGYCCKILSFNINSSTSTHYHIDKIEDLFVKSGEFEVKIHNQSDGKPYKKYLKAGDILHMPLGVAHKIICVSPLGGEIIEASQQCDLENSSYRIKDF